MRPKRHIRGAVLLAASPFLALGLWMSAKGIGNIRRSAQSVHFPKADATVTVSNVSSASSRAADGTRSATSYSANIEFQYQVNGAAYSTSTRHFGQTTGSTDSSEAELLRLRYPIGANTWVYYDPANPASAVAEPGFHANLIWLPGGGLFFIAAAAFALLFAGRDSTRAFRAGIAMFGSVFASLGLIGLAHGAVEIQRGRASVGWPRTQGQIVYQKIDSNQSRGTAGAGEGGTTQTSHGSHLIYQYQIAGRTYYSNQRRFGQLSAAGADWAEEIAAAYPPGSPIAVSYSPENPQLAVLEPGAGWEACWLPGAAGVSLLFGLGVLWLARRGSF